ncbi:hypothetical protein ABIC86_000651 [Paenibacillus sp. DS2363]
MQSLFDFNLIMLLELPLFVEASQAYRVDHTLQ